MTPKQQCKIHFVPSGLEVEAPAGTTILEAAQEAGIMINSICGGDGICGKCKVQVVEGKVDSPPTMLLSRDEVQRNYLLACQAKLVDGDVVVSIPEESRLGSGQILLDRDAERLADLGAGYPAGSRFRLDPLVKKFYLALEPPTIDNNLADHERVYQAIRQSEKRFALQTGFAALRALPGILREAGWKVTATVACRGDIGELVQIEPGDTSSRNYGVAIDVGTTTVVAHLTDMTTSKTVHTEATYNSQIKFGEDYIRRIMYAAENDALEVLQKTIIDDINDLITTLVQHSEISLNDITAVMCSGNTAMVHFLLGLDPSPIRKDPYIPVANFIPPIRAAQVGIRINARGLLFVLPSVAAYVGSDITAGVVVLGLNESEETCAFIDVGTNGEVVIGNKDWMVCCSASAGPAFEGSGVKNGMRASAGAIERLDIADDYEVTYSTIGGEPPRGICGSGLIDCIAALRRAGIVDRTGRFATDLPPDRLRQGEDEMEFVLVPAGQTATDSDIVITQADIMNLMRSKGAVYAAISTLLESVSLSADDLSHLYLAGGFGNYLDVNNAIIVGMLPDMPRDKVVFVGNTSVAGAKTALLSIEAYQKSTEVASSMTYFDLMANPRYMDEFISANFLPHTDIEKFPSVEEVLGRVK
jgi:uncharacterized 2Fe-2S/4Fe-4S cluster protein (DUF4445 family)